MFYYLLVGLVTGGFALAAVQLREYRYLFMFPLFVLTAYFVGFRDISIGTDTLRYSEIYFDIQPLSNALAIGNFGFEAQRIEAGFVLLASVFREFDAGFQHFLFFLNFLTVSVIFYSYQRIDKNIAPILVFLYTCTFTYFTLQYNIVRQGVAVAFCTLAFCYLLQNRRWPFLVLTLLGASFHSISILFLVVWPVRKFRWHPGYALVFIPLSIGVASVDFLQELTSLLSPYSVTVYRVANYMLTQAGEINLLSLSVVLDFLLIVYCIVDSKFLTKQSDYFNPVLTAFVIGFLGMLALHELKLLSLRYYYLFCPFEVITFYMALHRFTGRYLVKEVIVVSLGFLWLLKNVYVTAQFITSY